MNKGILHVGCGSDPLPDWLNSCKETRLDINPDVKPDIVAGMTDLGDIGTYDVILCRHALEHLHPQDVGKALAEFRRALNPSGYAIVFVPDLEDVKPTEDVLFISPAGPISGLDLMYGFRDATKENKYMMHLTGFNKDSLDAAMRKAGFSEVRTKRIGNYDLMGVGVK